MSAHEHQEARDLFKEYSDSTWGSDGANRADNETIDLTNAADELDGVSVAGTRSQPTPTRSMSRSMLCIQGHLAPPIDCV